MSLSSKALRAKAIALLARREYSRDELFRKLSAHTESSELLHDTLVQLEREGLLSDQRFADSLARVKGSRFGVARIQYELRNKGVDESVVQATLDELRSTEIQRATDVLKKRFDVVPVAAKERAKLHRFMAGRGFSSEAIARAIAALSSA
jgi:regulatory protein